MTHTHGPSLDDVIRSLEGRFYLHELDLPDIPVFLAIAIPDSDGVTGLKPRLPAGRGLNRQEARYSAAAESVELTAILAQTFEPSRHETRQRNGFTEILCSNIAGKEPAYFPAQRILLDWASISREPFVHDADSTGCACGIGWEDAVSRAMLECIERDAMALWWYGRQRRRHFDKAFLDHTSPRLSWWLTDRQREFQLIDVTSDIGIPVIAAVSHDAEGTHIAIGSAAAISSEAAATRAVTEMIQMEVGMSMSGSNAELDYWLQNASAKHMQQFHPLGEVAKPLLNCRTPQAELSRAGFDAFAIDLTRRNDPLSTARVIVPALMPLRNVQDFSRILTYSRSNPQYRGIQHIEERETIEPY